MTPDVATPRIPGMKDILAAGKKPMDVKGAPVAPVSAVEVVSCAAPEAAERACNVADASADGAIEAFAAALKAAREVERVVGKHTSLTLLNTLQEVREHAASLVPEGFITATPPEHLAHLERYLRALVMRVEKAASSPSAASQDAALAFQVSQAREVVDKARAKAASLPARCSAMATAASLPETTAMHLMSSPADSCSPSFR